MHAGASGYTKKKSIMTLNSHSPSPQDRNKTVAGNLYYIYVILYNNNMCKYIYKTNY